MKRKPPSRTTIIVLFIVVIVGISLATYLGGGNGSIYSLSEEGFGSPNITQPSEGEPPLWRP